MFSAAFVNILTQGHTKPRSPDQVKWPNYKTNFQSRHLYNVLWKVTKLSEYDKVINAYKTYISNFWHRWPQARSFLRPLYYVNGQKINSVIGIYFGASIHIWAKSYRVGQLFTIQVKFALSTPQKVIWGYPSPEVTNRHLPITFDQKDVGLVSVRSSRPGESTDMQYDPLRSPRDLDLTWPDVKLWAWPFKVIIYKWFAAP